MFQRKRSARTLIAALLGASSAVALLAAPAAAQTQPESDSRLDVIIITANQREEDLQDVPVSAASLPQDQIEAIFSTECQKESQIHAWRLNNPFVGH